MLIRYEWILTSSIYDLSIRIWIRYLMLYSNSIRTELNSTKRQIRLVNIRTICTPSQMTVRQQIWAIIPRLLEMAMCTRYLNIWWVLPDKETIWTILRNTGMLLDGILVRDMGAGVCVYYPYPPTRRTCIRQLVILLKCYFYYLLVLVVYYYHMLIRSWQVCVCDV